MKRTLNLIFLLVAITTYSFGQTHLISGSVIDKETKNVVEHATVQLLKTDSTYIGGTVTAATGGFKLTAPKRDSYILRISYVGYETGYCNINLTDQNSVSINDIELNPASIMLEGAEVTARLPKVQVKEDTLIYNTGAYQVPEGSVLEELVKLLPGIQVDDNGKITLNGKEVTKILVDGKEFFTGDIETAMKNLPISMIEKIKAYEQKSDLAKITGIDDGEEQTVLDLSVKPGMKKGILTNNDVGIGTDNRYYTRLTGTRFTDRLRLMVVGNAYNSSGKGGGSDNGRQGLNANKTAGINFNYDDKLRFQMDGSIRWNHNDADLKTISSSEHFVSTAAAFSNSRRNNMSRNDRWNANMRFEWKPDTMTDILFRPSVNYATNDSYSTNLSASYKEDPYQIASDPLAASALRMMAVDSLVVNSRNGSSINGSNNHNFGAELQFNRKLNNMGRNITLRATAGYGETSNQALSTTNVHLYQVRNSGGTDSTYQTNRFNVTPGKNWNYTLQATYSEPIMKATFLQFNYRFQYKYTRSNRATYDFSNLGETFFDDITPDYGLWDRYLNRLSNPFTEYEDESLSRYSEYKNYIHNINLMLRVIRLTYNFSMGMEVIPQFTHFIQEYRHIHTDTLRNVTNIVPTMDFTYKFSKLSQLRINYHGTTSQPSITDLLDITDDSNPLNIRKGNPGLKPSFTNNLRMVYNNNIKAHQRTIMANMNVSTTSNSISSMTEYNNTTGGRTTRPENINGNWNASGMFLFSTALDSAANWNISTATSMRYDHYAAYLTLNKNSSPEKNITSTTTYSESLDGGFRNKWLRLDFNGDVRFTDTKNLLQSSRNMGTWRFNYGVSANITLPWNMQIASDISENSRRGYSDASMNTNELIWNAQISQSFLKGNRLTVILQWYDILHQESTYSRTINASMRSDTEYNSITSYATLHVVYRIKQFGKKRRMR